MKHQQYDLSVIDAKIKKVRYNNSHSRLSNKRCGDFSPALSVWGVISELLAGCVVGLLLGVYLDRLFNTLPVFLILCTIFGSYGGLYNVYRALTHPSNQTNGDQSSRYK